MTAVARPRSVATALSSSVLLLSFAALSGCREDAVATAPAAAAATAPAVAPLHGRLEQHHGLRILRVWGTPAQRGFAHGKLLGRDIAAMLRLEFAARFARQPGLLGMARNALQRSIAYPPDVQQEIEALFRGIEASGADRDMPELGRPFDLQDLLVANALDVFGLMGCSGFTVWGDQVDGGGVLTGRNFDWPFTGAHLLDNTILLVEHDERGMATASVAWPGYVATVTGINRDGVAAFLHVGTGKITHAPEPESWPTAVAARQILEQVHGSTAADFERCRSLLEYTSPPAGYITRVVLPRPPQGDSPVGVFETDRDKVVRAHIEGPVVTTNHFVGRSDGRAKSKDSADREQTLTADIGQCLTGGDHKVSPAEGWEMLQSVDRGGKRAFGTLHAIVFRAEPWYCELRIAELKDEMLVPATRSDRRFVLTRDEVFAPVPK